MAFKPNYSTARLERERKKAAKKAAKLEAKQVTHEEPKEEKASSDWSIFDKGVPNKR